MHVGPAGRPGYGACRDGGGELSSPAATARAHPDLAAEVPWRTPRSFAAAASGGLLASSGALLERVTGNPLAGPDMLGAGAGFGLEAALLLGLGPTVSVNLAVGGGAAAGSAVLLRAMHGGFVPSRFVVVGLSLWSCDGALLGAFAATGDPRTIALLA